MNFYFHTLGCKVNQYETQAMMHLAETQGYSCAEYTVGQPDVGDGVIVINSCTVTGESDRKLRQLLRRCRRDNSQAVLVLTGCMPQAFPEEAEDFTEADIVLGNAARTEWVSYIHRFLASGNRIVDIPKHDRVFEDLTICEFQGRTRAFVKIEDGCDRFCTYCIIPYARGRVRSRSLHHLKQEVEQLAANGYQEIVLVGINLTAYGSDNGTNICDAVEYAASVEGICRVRLGSIEPDHLTPSIIERLAKCKKLCPQFHVALQSGCDATLKRMNRHYTTAEYRTVCQWLREAFPGCALTTDVMVGFPGETEEEFEQSLQFVNEMAFSRLHCFAYSRRAGTVAAKMKNQIPNAVKHERNRRMIETGEKSAADYAAALTGKTVSVLMETQSDKGCEGYTDTYVPVVVENADPGMLHTVHIDRAERGVCYGHILNK